METAQHPNDTQRAGRAPEPARALEREAQAGESLTLARACEILGLSRRELWQHVRAGRLTASQSRAGGPHEASVPKAQVLALGGALGRLAEPSAPAEPEVLSGRLWEEVRDLEVQRDRSSFELRVLAGQLRDLRGQLELAEESRRIALLRLGGVEADLDRELEERPEREELALRLQKLGAESAELARELGALRAEAARAESARQQALAELARVQSLRESERAECAAALARAAALEAQLDSARVQAQGREAYCDRVEAELARAKRELAARAARSAKRRPGRERPA